MESSQALIQWRINSFTDYTQGGLCAIKIPPVIRLGKRRCNIYAHPKIQYQYNPSCATNSQETETINYASKTMLMLSPLPGN